MNVLQMIYENIYNATHKCIAYLKKEVEKWITHCQFLVYVRVYVHSCVRGEKQLTFCRYSSLPNYYFCISFYNFSH